MVVSAVEDDEIDPKVERFWGPGAGGVSSWGVSSSSGWCR